MNVDIQIICNYSKRSENGRRGVLENLSSERGLKYWETGACDCTVY